MFFFFLSMFFFYIIFMFLSRLRPRNSAHNTKNKTNINNKYYCSLERVPMSFLSEVDYAYGLDTGHMRRNTVVYPIIYKLKNK